MKNVMQNDNISEIDLIIKLEISLGRYATEIMKNIFKCILQKQGENIV